MPAGPTPSLQREYARRTGLPLRSLPDYHGTAIGWENHLVPTGSAFVVELRRRRRRRCSAHVDAVLALARRYVGMTIVLVRHGETEWSASGKHTSVTDLPLTERGREAARALGARLAGREFALVLCSPRARARETALLAGFQPEIDADLVEVDYGVLRGARRTKEIRAERPELVAVAGRVAGRRDARRRRVRARTA